MQGRVCVLVFLLASLASAQMDQRRARPEQAVQEVTVRLAFTNGAACDSSVRVLLLGINGTVDAGLIDDHCVAKFSNVLPGSYRVTVSGRDFPPVDATIVVDLMGTQNLEVTVKRAGHPALKAGSPESSMVTAADLRIPASARKQYDKGNQCIAKKDWAKAVERLNRAIAIYPNYAAAYNALGVAYAHQGDRARERESLLKAISLNDRLAPAYVNLARMYIKTESFPDAETALNKASALDPTDNATLVLLAYAQFQDRHFDEAIATSRRAHFLAPAPHAFTHWIAAHALEQEHRDAEARMELRLFLNEEPSGPRAEDALKELAESQTASR